MQPHNFNASLQRERMQQAKADSFYIKTLKAEKVIRFNADNEADMVFQRKDIDAVVTLKGKEYAVSEKFRDNDWGDLLIELYSKYPTVKGWAFTGEAKRLAYFFPERVIWIDEHALAKFCNEQLFKAIPDSLLADLIKKTGSCREKYLMQLLGKTYHTYIINAHNRTDGATWNTISISVPFKLLNDNGIEYKCFSLS